MRENSDYMSSEADDTMDKKSMQQQKHDQKYFHNNRYLTISLYTVLTFLLILLVYKFVGNFNVTLNMIGYWINILSPFFIGAFIAFLVNPLVKWFRFTVFTNTLKLRSERAAKYLAIAMAYLAALGIIAILITFIVPQIYDNLSFLTTLIPQWYDNIFRMLAEFEQTHPDWGFIDYNIINQKLQDAIPTIISYITNMMSNVIPLIFTTSMAVIKTLLNFIIAIMISVYMVSDHKSLLFNFKRLLYAVIPKHQCDLALHILKESGRIFGGFIVGKTIDSLIIGCICFVLMMIFRFPFALLISIIVGITNMIPYFGPYMGGVLGGIILIIVSPVKVIFFAILILILQQFDGLYLGPKILGESTGLKPLWVIFAITVGGSLFGVLGMFLGVPCVAVISYILDMIIKHRFKRKHLILEPEMDTAEYQTSDKEQDID